MQWTLRHLMSESTTYCRLTSDAIHPSLVSGYVNDAQRDVANRIQQVEFERIAVSSTSSGDDKIFLPADCERVLNLSFDTAYGNRTLDQKNLWDVDAKSWGTQSGTPAYYVSYASWLQLYPSPNSNYSLLMRYVARLSDMTNLTAIPSIDTRYHKAVLYGTVAALAARKGDEVQAQFMRSLYERELNAQPSALEQQQRNRAGMHARVATSETERGGQGSNTDRWERSNW